MRPSGVGRQSSTEGDPTAVSFGGKLRLFAEIFQCFQGIHVVITQGYEQIINLNESRRRILQFLPNSCQKYYLLSESIGAYY